MRLSDERIKEIMTKTAYAGGRDWNEGETMVLYGDASLNVRKLWENVYGEQFWEQWFA